MKPVVFLDIDGVLYHAGEGCEYDPPAGVHTYYECFRFDKSCIEQLNRLTDAMDAEIVISSTWRLHDPFGDLVRFLRGQGVKARIIGRTPRLPGEVRGLEILNWLKGQDRDYVVIDDDDDITPHVPKEKFIHTLGGFHEGGLKKEHIDKFLGVV